MDMNAQQSQPDDGDPFLEYVDPLDLDTDMTLESDSDSSLEPTLDPGIQNLMVESHFYGGRRSWSFHRNQPASPPPHARQPTRPVKMPIRIAPPPIDGAPAVEWPPTQLPVELFDLITSHLTRAEIRVLRLVDREFEAKVSTQYFRNVVVPFRAELYSSMDRDHDGMLLQSASSLFSNGMRIFESFGRHIARFALSLELDEGALAYPPVKPVQEVVPAFWGVYRWPHAQYHRYTDLEELEQTADETESMRLALRHLSKVTNLGLCCDAGLGYLIGPDKATRDTSRSHPVFATQDWRHDQRRFETPPQPVITVADFNGVTRETSESSFDNPASFKLKVLQTMASDAGYSEAEIDEAISLMLSSEGTTMSRIDFDERMAARSDTESDEANPRTLADAGAVEGIYDFLAVRLPPALLTPARHPLTPAALTRAQKELLLELDWAHRAMIQSYVLCLVDNSRFGRFDHLSTLTIAKIPSSHLNILCLDELWGGIPSLRNVSLGVIADWRRITKPTPGCIEDITVSPLEAVRKVHHLLNRYIGLQGNIESIRFEWICGGEFAPSSSQRNRYILPAPFLQNPRLMAECNSAKGFVAYLYLRLPYIKHLALKNCWVSPHVMHEMVRQMTLMGGLEKLEFESVSLSGPPTIHPQATLLPAAPQHPPANVPAHANTDQMPQAAAHHVWPQANQIQDPILGNVPDLHEDQPDEPLLGHIAEDQPDGPFFEPIAEDQPGLPEDQPDEPEDAAMNDFLQPPDLLQVQGLAQVQGQNNVAYAMADAPTAGAPPVFMHPVDPLRPTEFFLWEGFMEHFSPGFKMRHIAAEHCEGYGLMLPARYNLDDLELYLDDVDDLERNERRYKLKTLSFKSCGYVSIDAPHLDTRAILPQGWSAVVPLGAGSRSDSLGCMQHCRDRMLGRISPYMEPDEVDVLTYVFGMEMGWKGVFGEGAVREASGDGVAKPGAGRFSGVIGG